MAPAPTKQGLILRLQSVQFLGSVSTAKKQNANQTNEFRRCFFKSCAYIFCIVQFLQHIRSHVRRYVFKKGGNREMFRNYFKRDIEGQALELFQPNIYIDFTPILQNSFFYTSSLNQTPLTGQWMIIKPTYHYYKNNFKRQPLLFTKAIQILRVFKNIQAFSETVYSSIETVCL